MMLLIAVTFGCLGLAVGMVVGYDNARERATAKAETDAWRVAREQDDLAALEAEAARRMGVHRRVNGQRGVA